MRHFYWLLILLVSFTATAQKNFAYIDEYRFAERKGEEKMVILTMPIGKSDIVSYAGDTAALRKAGALIIDVVCTDYPSNASLTALNQKRLNELFKRYTFLNTTQLQQVNFYRQLKGNTSATAAGMFHGLVIKFRTIQSASTIKDEIDKLDELLEIAMPERPPPPVEEPPAASDGADEFTTLESLRNKPKTSSNAAVTVYQDGRYVLVDPRQAVSELEAMGKLKTDTIKWIRGREIFNYFKPGSPYASLLQKSNIEVPIIITNKKDWFKTVIGDAPPVVKRKGSNINIDSIGKSGYKPALPDSTILKTFQRNNWNNMVVLADVTGSMYPYSAQLLIWIKSNFEKNATGNFIFFNDGDGKPDIRKVAGSTGGIHTKVCSSFEEAKELLKQTMRKGSGGDQPENNIEALINAEQQFPGAAYNVMIGDNWAPIKDKMLINRLAKPVRIILCGVYERINTDYLDLARLTKGSLHLANEDLVNLSQMNEGEVLRIGNYSYKIINGSFTDITDEKYLFRNPR